MVLDRSIGMVLEAINVTKEYKIQQKGKSRLRNIFAPQYKSLVAVDDLSFSISKGETVGYIGLNGAGKSTTIKLLTGILTPTKGDVKLFGEDISKNKMDKNRRISVVFGQRSNLWYDLPVIDSYNYIKELYGVSSERYKKNLEMVCDCLEIENLLQRPVRKLSLGQKMKCELGVALLYDAEILFLDEPTIGMDIFVRDNFINCIQEMRKKTNTTIFLTTHNMEEVDKLCDRIIVLDKGKLLFDGNAEQIRKIVGDFQQISFILADNSKVGDEDIYDKYIVEKKGNDFIKLNIDKNEVNTADIMKHFFTKYEVKDVNIENSSLEQLIKQLYKGEGQ